MVSLRDGDRNEPMELQPLTTGQLVVDRSTTGWISSGFNGNWLDGTAAQATRADLKGPRTPAR
jgi:hypothetical protein